MHGMRHTPAIPNPPSPCILRSETNVCSIPPSQKHVTGNDDVWLCKFFFFEQEVVLRYEDGSWMLIRFVCVVGPGDV